MSPGTNRESAPLQFGGSADPGYPARSQPLPLPRLEDGGGGRVGRDGRGVRRFRSRDDDGASGGGVRRMRDRWSPTGCLDTRTFGQAMKAGLVLGSLRLGFPRETSLVSGPDQLRRGFRCRGVCGALQRLYRDGMRCTGVGRSVLPISRNEFAGLLGWETSTHPHGESWMAGVPDTHTTDLRDAWPRAMLLLPPGIRTRAAPTRDPEAGRDRVLWDRGPSSGCRMPRSRSRGRRGGGGGAIPFDHWGDGPTSRARPLFGAASGSASRRFLPRGLRLGLRDKLIVAPSM